MLYTIENNKLKVTVASTGALLQSFVLKELNRDIVLGFDNEQDYIDNHSGHIGVTVGRSSNRIGNASFTLNGETYKLDANNGPNNLHSGQGVSYKEFTLKEKSDTSLVLTYFSKDLEDGFPGNLDISVKYELNDDKLRITFDGLSDKDTIFNMTNHSYFNLDGATNDALSHEMKLYSDKVAVNDENGMATSIVRIVNDTAFDFREYHVIKDNLALDNRNLSGGGIDHNYVFENLEPKKMVSLRNKDIELTISSDLPGCQIYTANFLGNLKAKNGITYQNYYGVAIEPQYYPNSINYSEFLKPILKANEKVSHYIEYEVKGR